MNKQYVYLSSEEMLIINEDGKLSKRDVESNNMHELLTAENNLERVNAIITVLENSLNQADLFSSYSKKDKIITCLLPLILAAITVGASSLLGSLNLAQVLSTSPMVILIFYAMFGGTFILSEKQKVRMNNGVKKELESAYQLRETYEKKLNLIKTKTEKREEQKENVIDSQEIVSLEESMDLPSEARKQLTEAFKEGYGPKVKKLTLKR